MHACYGQKYASDEKDRQTVEYFINFYDVHLCTHVPFDPAWFSILSPFPDIQEYYDRFSTTSNQPERCYEPIDDPCSCRNLLNSGQY